MPDQANPIAKEEILGMHLKASVSNTEEETGNIETLVEEIVEVQYKRIGHAKQFATLAAGILQGGACP